LKDISPFKIQFREMKYFGHKGSTTMWLQPEAEKPDQVIQLNTVLEKAFPYCNDLSAKSDHGFAPHLSLGQFPKSEVEGRIKQFMASWKPIEFLCSEVYMISRSDFDDPFKIIYRVPFGNGNLVEPELMSAPAQKKVSSTQKPGATLFVSNLPFKLDQNQLKSLFEMESHFPISVKLATKPGGQSKGFGFAEFASEEEAQKAIQALDKKQFEGREISVQMSRSK